MGWRNAGLGADIALGAGPKSSSFSCTLELYFYRKSERDRVREIERERVREIEREREGERERE